MIPVERLLGFAVDVEEERRKVDGGRSLAIERALSSIFDNGRRMKLRRLVDGFA